MSRSRRCFVIETASARSDQWPKLRSWVLDVVMGEDANRTRVDRAPKNLALLRKCVLNLLRRETSSTRGVKGKQKNAAWDDACLLTILPS